MRACSACGTENPDIARFCLACGSPLEAQAPPEEERKPVTALFVDIVGSTSRAEELDPENVLALLEPYYARLRHELERHGGTVEKFIGDAVVAVFGAPAVHEDDAERAVRAAFAVVDAIHRLNEEDPSRDLKVRVGVTTGDAIVSLGAHSGEGRGFAWGDVLNTAARIQSAAPVNGILVGNETYYETLSAVEYRRRDSIEAKGKAEPVRVWEAVRLREKRARPPARNAAPRSGRRARAAGRPLDKGVRGARAGDRSGGRPGGGGQESPARRGDGAGGENGLGPHRPLPLVRRGHHLLARARDRQGGRRHRARRRAGRRHGEARRATRAFAPRRHGSAPHDRGGAREPDRHAPHTGGDVPLVRDLTGRAALGHQALLPAARRGASARGRLRRPALGRADAARADRLPH